MCRIYLLFPTSATSYLLSEFTNLPPSQLHVSFLLVLLLITTWVPLTLSTCTRAWDHPLCHGDLPATPTKDIASLFLSVNQLPITPQLGRGLRVLPHLCWKFNCLDIVGNHSFWIDVFIRHLKFKSENQTSSWNIVLKSKNGRNNV